MFLFLAETLVWPVVLVILVDRARSSGRCLLLLGELQQHRIVQIRTVFRTVLQQLQMPRPHRIVVPFCLARYEAAFDRRLGELLECHAASGRHHQGDPVVGQPAVDRLYQIQASVVEEEAVGAQDHIIETRWQSSIFVGRPDLHREIIIVQISIWWLTRDASQCTREFRFGICVSDYRHKI